MSSSYDAMMQAFRQRQDSLSARKREQLSRASEIRQKHLDPNLEFFDPAVFSVIDADTLINNRTEERLRLTGGEGRTINSFESDPKHYEDPARLQAHKRAFGKLFGKKTEDVTVEDLTNMGKVQARRLQERLQSMKGARMRRGEKDQFGRTLMQFDDSRAFEQAMGLEGNASYFSPANYKRVLDDAASGKLSELNRQERSLREVGTDQLANFVTGGGRMANDLGQAIATILQANTEGVDKFFENNRERLENFKANYTSQGQQDRERFAAKRAGIREDLFSIRKEEYLEAGETENMASIKASMDAYGDTISDLINEPGRILDAAIESLPYMIGVGAVGKATANAVTRSLAQKTLTRLKKAGADKEQIKDYLKKYMSGKEAQGLINRAANTAGIATVGLTEGLSNAAETYASTVGMSEEEAGQSEKYQELRKQGLNHRESVEKLGENVFWQTLITTTGLAAAASAVTGAGAFEAGLFRVTPKTIKKIGKEAVEEAKDGPIKAAAKATGRGARYVTGPGLKEFAEESIQSGGGEFLSQLAEYDAGLIDQVGPGIGEATAEGGVVGFASGAGAAAVTAGPKAIMRKIGDINQQFSESKLAEVTIRNEGSAIPGGQARSAPIDTKQDPYEAFMAHVKTMTDGKAPDVSSYKELETLFMDSYAELTPEQREDAAKALQTMRHLYHGKLKQEADQVLAKPAEEYTPEDQQILFSAVEEKILNPDQVEGPLGEVLKRFAAADQIASAAMDDAGNDETIETVRQVTGQSDQEYRRVAQEKLDDVHSSKGPGLLRHIRLLKEAARLNDSKLWGDRAEAFERFLGSQETKVNRVEAFLDAVTQEGADIAAIEEAYGLKYVPGSTEGYLKILQTEQEKMNAAVQEITEAYNAWKAPEAPVEAETAPTTPEPETPTEPAPVELEPVPDEGPIPESENPAPPEEQNEEEQTTAGEPTVEETPEPEDTGPTEREDDTAPEEESGTAQVLNEVVVSPRGDEEVYTIGQAQAYVIKHQFSEDREIRDRVSEMEEELYSMGSLPNISAEEQSQEDQIAPDDRDIYRIKDGPTISASNLEYFNLTEDEVEILKEQGDIEIEYGFDELDLGDYKIGQHVEIEQNNDDAPALIAEIEEFSLSEYRTYDLRLSLRDYILIDRNQKELDLEAKTESKKPPAETETGAEAQPEAERTAEVEDEGAVEEEQTILEETETLPEVVEQDEQEENQSEQLSEQEQAAAQNVYDDLEYFEQVQEGYRTGVNSEAQMRYVLGVFGVTEIPENTDLKPIIKQVWESLVDQIPENFTPAQVDEQTRRNLQEKTRKLQNGEQVYARDTLKDTVPITDESRIEQLFKWAGLPFGKGAEKAIDKVLDRVRNGYTSGKNVIIGLANANLPEALSDHFTRRSDKTNSLLSSIKDLAELLTDATFRATFRREAKLNVGEDIALTLFKDFRNELAAKFQEMIQDLNHPTRGKFAGEWLRNNPLYYYKDQLGQMDSNVMTAMALEAMNWLAASRLHSTPYMMNSILGQNGDTQLTDSQISMLEDKVHLRTQVYEQIGNAAIKQLNIKRREDSPYDAEMYDKLSVALGLAAIATMKEAGFVEIKKLPRAWLAENSQLNIDLEGPDILFVRPAPSDDPNSYDVLDKVADIRESWEVGKRVFEQFFGVKTLARWPQSTTPKATDVPTRISRSLTRISKKMRDRIDRMQRRPWQANMPVVNLVNRFIPQDLLALAYEYDEDLDSVHSEHEKARRARNASYLMELDQARKWGESKGDDTFYFTYHMSQSGRVFISSNTINPQTSKIHRFMFGMNLWNTEVSFRRGLRSKVFRNFLLSVAQGIDIDIDKLSQKDVLKKLKEKMQLNDRFLPTEKSPLNKVLEIINGEGQITEKQLEILRPFVEDTGVHALAALQAYNNFVTAHRAGEKSFMSNLPIETDGITNGLSLGMMQTPTGESGYYGKIKNMLRATGIMFENDPSSFAGWIRNGKNKDNYVDTANRVGDFIRGMMDGLAVHRAKDTRHENWQKRDALIRKHANNYNLFQSNFLPTLEELFAEGGVGRKWAKSPLMITGYGASLVAVINSIAEAAYDKFLEQMAETNNITANVADEDVETAYVDQLQTMLNLINQAYGFVAATVDASQFNQQYQDANVAQWTMEELVGKLERDYDGDIRRMAREFTLDQAFPGIFNRKTGKTSPNKTAADLFKDAVKATYGEAMAVALEEKLQPVEEIRQELNAANKLMNEIFVRDYARRLAAYQDRLGHILNKDERKEIFEQMFAQGLVPSVAMAYSDPDDVTQNLETTNYDKTTVEDSQVNLVLSRAFQVVDEAYDELTRQKVKPPTQKNITAALLARIPDTDVGVSAVVKLIHAIDGANNSFAWGQDWSVLNMHDAQVSSIAEMDEVVNGVNKDLRELMGNYSLPGAMLEALERMQPLLDDTDPRLSRVEKDAVYKAFADHLEKHQLVSEEQRENFTPRQIYEEFTVRLEDSVNQADQARERLLNESTSFGQYSLEGLEYVIEDIDYSFKGYEKVRTGEQEQKRQNVVDNLLLNYRSGNLRKAVLDWIDKDEPDFRTALQITQAFLVQNFEQSEDETVRAAVEEIRQLTSLLWPHLTPYATSGTRVVTVPSMHAEGDPETRHLGLYVPSEDAVRISHEKSQSGISIIDTLLHELLHAANSTVVWKMQFENADRFDELTEQVKANVAELENVATKGRSGSILRVLKGHLERKEYDQAITEYFSYLLASFIRQDPNSVLPGKPWEMLLPESTTKATQTLVSALKKPGKNTVGGLVLHSSPNEVNHANFAGKSSEQIETKNLQDLFDRLGQLDQQSTNPEHQHRLQSLINRVLLPGLKSIAPLMYQYATDPAAMQHAGDWRAQNNLVRVQSAGNPLTNNAEMSLQEIFTHEVLHAIAKAAFGDPSITDDQIKAAPKELRQGLIQMRQGNPKLRNEIERIFEQVRDAKDQNGDPLITWESFMPETVVGDQQAAEAAAKARYDHIFNGGAESIHEFFAIALTNHEFATVLSSITNQDTRGPIWDGGILSSLMNILDRIVQWITGQMLKTNQKNIHASLFSLAQTVVDFNDRAALELDAVDDKKLLRNKVDEWINRNSEQFLDRVQEKLRTQPGERSLDPTFLEKSRSAAHAALVRRRKAGREAQAVLLKKMGLEKDSWVSRIASEVVSYNEEDKGTGPGNPGFIDLLGHSKYQIDVARQRMIEHSRDTLVEMFDPDKRLTVAQREALTHAVLRTDLDGLFENDPEVNDLQRLLDIIRSERVRSGELDRAVSELQAIVADNDLVNMLLNQANSMANLMIHGKATVKNSMMNAHNIVKQYNRANFRRQDIAREDDAIAAIERIGTLMAIGKLDGDTRSVASEVLQHELDRQVEDNGFSTLLGMHSDFKALAKEYLFRNNPTQMIKGYVYEMLDDDINVQFVKDIPSEHRRMKELGMVRVAELTRDTLDDSKAPATVMYKGLHGGLGGYQKSIVSLTNMQHRGHNLYTSHDYDSQSSLENLGKMRTKAYRRAEMQRGDGYLDEDQNMVPVLDDQGNIADYRYLMTESVKKEHFKKRDEFDKALPRMFGSISDRVGTVGINRQVVDLLYDEYQKYGPNAPDNPHRFVMVGESVPLYKKGVLQRNPDGSIIIDKNAQAMWRLLPDDMKRAIEGKFGTKAFPIRDNAVNLVLGFRKLSVADNKYLGKASFTVRTAEKIWLEAMQFLRIKVALLTPEVVIGNTASNYAILLSEGIPVNYIRKMTGEALKGIRKYQKDVKRLDKIQRYIGIRQSQGRATQKLEREADRLQATLRANPVDQLIQEGMFTSIVEDLGTGEDTLRERGVDWLLDHTHGKIPAGGIKAASEFYMLPGTRTFHAAQLATQYGDFVGRYIKYHYDVNVRGKSEYEAKHDALAAFIFYDMPQHRSLQFANDYGFVMFTKFFARIQHVVANLFLHNPTKAAGVLAVQQALAPALMQENIANYALMQGATRKFEPVPMMHLDRIEPWEPSMLMWLRLLGIGG